LSRAAPIVVTAQFADRDQAWLDGLRRTHFPAERNHVPAHLTLFHHLPPSIELDLRRRLAACVAGPAPVARIVAVQSLGRGVALAIESNGLQAIRDELADAFAGQLTLQDAGGWRPHVTVQNKVEPAAAHALKAQLEADFAPRTVALGSLAAWWYRGGPWEPLSEHRFR
jgi:hypothetical protein